jgi:hypothetical protein
LTKYDDLLLEVKLKAKAYRSTAKVFIPKMYNALRKEDPNITPQDARDRIEKDCRGIVWEKRTILDALPDEAKDPEKQKAGRLGQKKRNFAAFSAAPSCEKKKEIIIDTQGKPIQKNFESSPAQLTTVLSDNRVHGISKNNEYQLQNDDDLVRFQFSLPTRDVFNYLVLGDRDNEKNKKSLLWFHGKIDKHTGKVISASVGKASASVFVKSE